VPRHFSTQDSTHSTDRLPHNLLNALPREIFSASRFLTQSHALITYCCKGLLEKTFVAVVTIRAHSFPNLTDRMERWSRLCWLGIALLAAVAHAFAPLPRAATLLSSRTTFTADSAKRPVSTQLAFRKQHNDDPRLTIGNKLERVLDRLDTLKTAGFVDSTSSSRRPLMMRGPGFKRIAFWLFVGFMYKWYRARFINKVRTYT
jgi:hypothetical protein